MAKDMNTTRFRRTSLLNVTLVVATVLLAGCLVALVGMENGKAPAKKNGKPKQIEEPSPIDTLFQVPFPKGKARMNVRRPLILDLKKPKER